MESSAIIPEEIKQKYMNSDELQIPNELKKINTLPISAQEMYLAV